MLRRCRNERPALRGYRVGERDREILRGIGRMKFARTSSIRSLFFGDPSTCSRRMAKLVALNLCAVFVPSLNAENVYSLTPRGRALLLAEGVDESEIHLGRTPSPASLDHLLAINAIRVALVVACRARTDVSIDLFLSDLDLRRVSGFSTARYQPDALVRLVVDDNDAAPSERSIGLTVEWDAGTESPRYFAEHKGKVLRELHTAGEPCWGLAPWRPILVAPTVRRLRALAGPLAAEGDGAFWLGTDLATLNTVGALGPAFATIATVAETPRGAPVQWSVSLLDPPEGAR